MEGRLSARAESLDEAAGRRKKELRMHGHKYQVGETALYTPARILSARGSSPCEILRLLSTDGDDPQYRVKCLTEGFERVVRESELSGQNARP
jgi:hypothetical protein